MKSCARCCISNVYYMSYVVRCMITVGDRFYIVLLLGEKANAVSHVL